MSSSQRRRSGRHSRRSSRSRPNASQQWQASRRQRRWLRSMRKKLKGLGQLNPLAAVLQPKEPGNRSRRDLVAVKLRLASYALLWIVATSVVLASLPLGLGRADWYLRAMANMAGNGPLAIAALGLGAMALYMVPGGRESEKFAGVLAMVSRLGFVLFVALLPLQLIAAAWLIQQTQSADREQVARMRNDTAALLQEARTVTSKQAFAQLLQRRSIGLDRAALEANPLEVAQAGLEQSVQGSVSRLENQLAARRRQGYFRIALDLLKLSTTCIIMALFLRLYVIWSLEGKIRSLKANQELAQQETSAGAEATIS